MRLTLADEVLAGRYIRTTAERTLVDTVAGFVPVIFAHDVADLLVKRALAARDERTVGTTINDMGPVAVPFNAFFVLGTTAELTVTYLMLCVLGPRDEHGVAGLSIELYWATTKAIVGPIAGMSVLIDAGGVVQTVSDVAWALTSDFGREFAARLAWEKKVPDVGGVALQIAICTLSFLNCKNVALQRDPVSRQIRRAEVRAGRPEPVERFRLLVTHTATLSKIGERQQRRYGARSIPITQRSHTKTYTEEGKLFGKHVGTFLWSGRVTGDREYEIKVKEPFTCEQHGASASDE